MTPPGTHPPTHRPSTPTGHVVGVDLNDGWIALPLAAALAAAGALVWQRRRQRYQYGPLDPTELDDVDLIPLPGTITAARRALREQAPHLLSPPPAAQPTVAGYAADQYRQPLPSPDPTASTSLVWRTSPISCPAPGSA